MRMDRIWLLLSITCLRVLMVSGIAWAHVLVSPKEAPANSYQKFTVSVPTEQDIPTTEVRVEVPEGFTVTGVQPVPGWQHEFEKDSGVIKTITWSGEDQPRRVSRVCFAGSNPEGLRRVPLEGVSDLRR